jgi:hypothetical protein
MDYLMQMRVPGVPAVVVAHMANLRVHYPSGTPVTVFGNSAEGLCVQKAAGRCGAPARGAAISFARENSTPPAVISGALYLADATWLVANCG